MSLTFNLTSLNGSNGFSILGENANDKLASASTADLNNDGIQDLLAGATQYLGGGYRAEGIAYILFGTTDFSLPFVDVTSLEQDEGHDIQGQSNPYPCSLGSNVAGLGDINGDGLEDIGIGCHISHPHQARSYVIFGKNNNNFDIQTLTEDSIADYGILIKSYPSLGKIIPLGDVNGDGVSDIGITDLHDITGRVHVIFGSSTLPTVTDVTSGLSASQGFTIIGSTKYFADSVSHGDLNNDGLDDIIIAAPDADPFGRGNAGSVFIIFGSSSNFPTTLNAASIDGTTGFKIHGLNSGSTLGLVSAEGDINNDGINDLVLVTPNTYYSGGGYSEQSIYIIPGRETLSGDLDLAQFSDEDGIKIGASQLLSLGYISYHIAVGDANNDHIDDILVSMRATGSNQEGRVYVIPGRSDLDYPAELDFANGVASGYVITEGGSKEYLLANPADINGDGALDIIVGGPEKDSETSNDVGAVHIIYGTHSTNQVLITECGTYTGTDYNDEFRVDVDCDVTITTGKGNDTIIIYPYGGGNIALPDFDYYSDNIQYLGNCSNIDIEV